MVELQESGNSKLYIAPNEVVLNADGPTEVFNNNSTLIDVLDNDLNVENAVPYIVK